jgi:hypothetical protein
MPAAIHLYRLCTEMHTFVFTRTRQPLSSVCRKYLGKKYLEKISGKNIWKNIWKNILEKDASTQAQSRLFTLMRSGVAIELQARVTCVSHSLTGPEILTGPEDLRPPRLSTDAAMHSGINSRRQP